jgi:hypothetical protein
MIAILMDGVTLFMILVNEQMQWRHIVMAVTTANPGIAD